MTRKPEKKCSEMLRQRFYAQTDSNIDPEPEDWMQYAEWLEKLTVKELNDELVRENEILRNAMLEARDILETSLVATYTRIMSKGGVTASTAGASQNADRWLYPLLVLSKKAGSKQKGGK